MRVPALKSAIAWFSGEKVVLVHYLQEPEGWFAFLTTAHRPFLRLLNQGGNPERTEGEPR